MGGSILHRLDIAIERERWRYPESGPRRFYLTEDDWREFDEAVRMKWPDASRTFSYRDIQIYPGNRSRLINKHGCMVCVPKHVGSRKTRVV